MVLCLAACSFGSVVFVAVGIHGIERQANNWLHFGINSLNGNGIGGGLHLLSRSAFDRGRCKDRQLPDLHWSGSSGACNMK